MFILHDGWIGKEMMELLNGKWRRIIDKDGIGVMHERNQWRKALALVVLETFLDTKVWHENHILIYI